MTGVAPVAPQAVPEIEPGQIGHLLQIAGPETARTLIVQLAQDLGAVRHGLCAAFTGPDWQALRQHSHVLIALSGTAGAQALHRAAQHLNALSHQPDPDALPVLHDRVLHLLDHLISHVAGLGTTSAPP